jgi:hypothetical protein
MYGTTPTGPSTISDDAAAMAPPKLIPVKTTGTRNRRLMFNARAAPSTVKAEQVRKYSDTSSMKNRF